MKLKFGWIDKSTFGRVIFDTEVITINLDLFIADVFIHERLHLQHQDWSEVRVIRETRKRIDRMTVKEIKGVAETARTLAAPRKLAARR